MYISTCTYIQYRLRDRESRARLYDNVQKLLFRGVVESLAFSKLCITKILCILSVNIVIANMHKSTGDKIGILDGWV